MCKQCGCGVPDPNTVPVEGESLSSHLHEHGPEMEAHEHSHARRHEAGHHHHGPEGPHAHSHSDARPDVQQSSAATRTVQVRRSILETNDRKADRNRQLFEARQLFAINVLSSPGSGKTTLLQRTLKMLPHGLKAGVIVGDLATENDAVRLRESGAPVAQITTGTMCHLEAAMVSKALKTLDLSGPGLLFIENVGNLVCPAAYDLGEALRVVLISVTEGEDKPLKYPPMFQTADLVVISKTDLAGPCGWDRKVALENISRVAPRATILECSAKTGQGMETWIGHLARLSQPDDGARG